MSLKSFCGMKKRKRDPNHKGKIKFSLLENDILNMENPKDSIKENKNKQIL